MCRGYPVPVRGFVPQFAGEDRPKCGLWRERALWLTGLTARLLTAKKPLVKREERGSIVRCGRPAGPATLSKAPSDGRAGHPFSIKNVNFAHQPRQLIAI